MQKRTLGRAFVVLAAGLLLSACGGGGGSDGGGKDPAPPATLQDVRDGLVTEYRCNGNTVDSVGGVNGVGSGGFSYVADRSGNANAAWSFDGVDGRVVALGTIRPAGSTGFTASFWIKNLLPAFDGSIMIGGGSSVFSFTSLVDFVILPGATGSVNANLPAETWTHVVGTYDDTTQVMSIYLNGVLANEMTKGSPVGGLDLDGLEIGHGSWPAGSYWSGALDDIRLYGRALSAEEVKQLYDFQS